MKRYQSHKFVEAGRIARASMYWEKIEVSDGNGGVTAVSIPHDFFGRGAPQIGDYLVRYEDGYLSWSPKAVFEAGYTEIAE